MLIKENDIHKFIVEYALLRRPNTVIQSNYLVGALINKRTAAMSKALGYQKGTPDLFFAFATEDYHGLYIEVKTKAARLFTKKNVPYNEHVAQQVHQLRNLNNEGYLAVFARGEKEGVEIFDYYHSLYKGDKNIEAPNVITNYLDNIKNADLSKYKTTLTYY
jgi:hypothetical protein